MVLLDLELMLSNICNYNHELMNKVVTDLITISGGQWNLQISTKN